MDLGLFIRRAQTLEDDAIAAVRPHGDRSPLGIHIALELLDTVLALWLLALDDNLWRFLGVIGVDDNVCRFCPDLHAKLDTGL